MPKLHNFKDKFKLSYLFTLSRLNAQENICTDAGMDAVWQVVNGFSRELSAAIHIRNISTLHAATVVLADDLRKKGV